MEEVNDVQALEKISNEVDESQIKVILSSQCIKAQAFLLDKLKKQAERHKETCGFISSANLKLQAEIKQAEQEINSMRIAQSTIKMANVEIRKEWLIAKEQKIEITERIEVGTKRYEDLWLGCKARYESIPFVQNLLSANEKVQALNNDIEGLDKQIISLYESMKTRREACIDLDRKRCIELANYMVHEMPSTMKIIKEKSQNINDLTQQIEEMVKEQNTVNDAAEVKVTEEAQNLETIENRNNDAVKDDNDLNKSEEDSLIPKLELTNFDLDLIDVNLERAKMKNDELPNSILSTVDPLEKILNTKIEPYKEGEKPYEYVISPYFNSYKEKEQHNFSNRKLINILEDVHLDKDEVYNIVKKVNPKKLRKTNEISVDLTENVRDQHTHSKDAPIESDTIEEVDMTYSNIDIIIPPTQFLDITLPSSQDSIHKKRVSFELPSSIQINEILDEVNKQNDVDDNEAANQTMNSQDASIVSDDSYAKIQDMILKKHNLDLSPQFVYAKNPVLQKRDDDNIVTSKFFSSENQEDKTDEAPDHIMEIDEPKVQEPEEKLKESENLEELKLRASPSHEPMDVDEIVVSSPIEKKKHEEPEPEKPISGLLFTHGTQAIPDSLNVSISTTGYDDSDFPHCIDSSLLLSPKADIPMIGENSDVQSQEVPNFLSGFRKAGLSFFGGGNATSSEPKPDSSAPTDGNNFSFNFGGEKKNRGGGNATSSEPKPDSSAPTDGNNFSFNFGGEKKNRGGLFSLFN